MKRCFAQLTYEYIYFDSIVLNFNTHSWKHTYTKCKQIFCCVCVQQYKKHFTKFEGFYILPCQFQGHRSTSACCPSWTNPRLVCRSLTTAAGEYRFHRKGPWNSDAHINTPTHKHAHTRLLIRCGFGASRNLHQLHNPTPHPQPPTRSLLKLVGKTHSRGARMPTHPLHQLDHYQSMQCNAVNPHRLGA